MSEPLRESAPDAAVLRIDEPRFLGAKLPAATALVDSQGKAFTLGEVLVKPVILLLSYYRCDGACPAMHRQLAATLDEIKGKQIGRDYRVLSISFDPKDDAASAAEFVQRNTVNRLDGRGKSSPPPSRGRPGGGWGFQESGKPDAPAGSPSLTSEPHPLPNPPLEGEGAARPPAPTSFDDPGWRHAVLAAHDEASVRAFTEQLGYRYFWADAARAFMHPNALVFLTPQGRVARYLYGTRMDARAIELALTEADWERISQSAAVFDMLTGACFSYNYATGRYQWNYSLLTGVASFFLGLALLASGLMVYRKRQWRMHG